MNSEAKPFVPPLVQAMQGVAKTLAHYLDETGSRTVIEYLAGYDVLWEMVGPKPVPRPLFDMPATCADRWQQWDQSRPQPALVFTIGAPGSGKSTWAKYTYGQYAVVAADDWFDLYNDSAFDPKHLSTAHDWCKEQVFKRLREGISCVVNNTNTTLNEMFEYVAAVEFGNYPHRVIFARMPETNIDTLHSRGAHGVPKNKIKVFISRIRGMGVPSVARVLQAGPMRKRGLQPSTQVLYTGIFFDTKAREVIARSFMGNARCKGLLHRVCNFHVTINFLPTRQDVLEARIGREVQVLLTGYVSHPEVQILVTDVDDDVKKLIVNDTPHITVATNTVQPAVANYALKHARPISIQPAVKVHGVIGVYMRGSGKIITDMKHLTSNWDVIPQQSRSRRGSKSPRRPGSRGGGRPGSAGSNSQRLHQGKTPSPRSRW